MKCPQCGFFLGGSSKTAKITGPKCTSVFLDASLQIYSCNTSSHDNRCLVIIDSKKATVICHLPKCKESRAIMVNSNMPENFSCIHVESVKEASPPLRNFSVIGDLGSYQCGDTINQQLVLVDQLTRDLPVAVQVSPSMFCVFGRATTNTPNGYCHVQVKNDSRKSSLKTARR